MRPGGGSGAEPRVEIVLGAFTEVPSAVGQPGQEYDRHGEALVGAVAERRRSSAAGPHVVQQVPAEEPFEQLAVLGIANGVELCGSPALEVSQAPVAGRQRIVTNQQQAQVFHSAVRPDGIQGGVAAGHAVTGQVPRGLAGYRVAAQPLQVAVLADPSPWPAIGAARVALAAAYTGREPGRIGLAPARPRHAGAVIPRRGCGPVRAGLELHHRSGRLARNLCSGPAEQATLSSFCSVGGDAVRPTALELLDATGGH